MKKLMIFILFFSFLGFNNFTVSQANAGASETDEGLAESVGDRGMYAMLCGIMRFVTGNVGKTFASFAIIAVGIGFLTGKTTWVAMITFALGIAAIFGAPVVIKALTGGDEVVCSNVGNTL